MTKPSPRYEAALAAFRRSGGSVTRDPKEGGYTLVATVGSVSARAVVKEDETDPQLGLESAFFRAVEELYAMLPPSA